MPSYSATVQLSNGTLSVTRPHSAPSDVDDVIDSLVWAVRNPDSTVTSAGLTVVTTDTSQQPAPEPLPPQEALPDAPAPDAAPDAPAADSAEPSYPPDVPGPKAAADPLNA